MFRAFVFGAATMVGPTARLASTKSWRILGLGLFRRRRAGLLGLAGNRRRNLLRSSGRSLLRGIGSSARIWLGHLFISHLLIDSSCVND